MWSGTRDYKVSSTSRRFQYDGKGRRSVSVVPASVVTFSSVRVSGSP